MQRHWFAKGLMGWLLLSVLLGGCDRFDTSAPRPTTLSTTLLPSATLAVSTTTPLSAPPLPTSTQKPSTATVLTGAPQADVNQAFDALKAALAGYQNGGEEAGRIIAAVSDAASAFLAETGLPPTRTTADALAARLQTLLPGGQKPITVLADLDGDGQTDCLLAVPGMFDFPALVFLSTDHYGSRLLPPDDGAPGLNDNLLPAAWPSGAQALDLTGDGQPEALITFQLPGGSGVTDRVHAFRWIAQSRSFTEIFRATLVTWAGPSTWKTQPSPAGSQEFVLSGPAFGVFDYKLLAHPTATQVWQWSADAGRFVKSSDTITPPQNRRQAVNVGEAFLRQGDYAQAAQAYHAAIEDTALITLPETENAPDWAAFAALRLGQANALNGKEAEARAALQQAITAGGHIGELAGAFLNAYHGGQTTASAWGAFMKRLDLNGMLYQAQAGNLGFPMDAFSIYYPGLGVTAYLNDHSDARDLQADRLQAALKAAGIVVESLRVADVDGNGSLEVAFITPDRSAPDQLLEHAWLAYRQSNRWYVTLLTEGPQLILEKTVPLAGKGEIIAIRYPEGFDPPLVGYKWQNGKAIRYDLSSGAPTLLPDDDWPIIGE
jgi:hypothetical protein